MQIPIFSGYKNAVAIRKDLSKVWIYMFFTFRRHTFIKIAFQSHHKAASPDDAERWLLAGKRIFGQEMVRLGWHMAGGPKLWQFHMVWPLDKQKLERINGEFFLGNELPGYPVFFINDVNWSFRWDW